jgi:hypothetical protein
MCRPASDSGATHSREYGILSATAHQHVALNVDGEGREANRWRGANNLAAVHLIRPAARYGVQTPTLFVTDHFHGTRRHRMPIESPARERRRTPGQTSRALLRVYVEARIDDA